MFKYFRPPDNQIVASLLGLILIKTQKNIRHPWQAFGVFCEEIKKKFKIYALKKGKIFCLKDRKESFK